MLLEKHERSKPRVAVVTRSHSVTRLFNALLKSWSFELSDHPSSAGLLLAEWGMDLLVPPENRIWLAPMPMDARHLKIPISLEALYHCVEGHFFQNPRAQMRVALQQPALLYVAGEVFSVEVLSLSGRGARVVSPREFAQGEPLSIEMELGGRRLYLSAEVLYQLPGSDFSGGRQAQVGLSFRFEDAWLGAALALCIERLCVETACAESGLSMEDACLSWLILPKDPWGILP